MSSKMKKLYFMRYWYAATAIGKMVLLIILIAYTKRTITIANTYKDELYRYYDELKKNGKTKKSPDALYKGDFTPSERKKLEDPHVDPETFDVTMMDKVLRRLQLLTGLSDHQDAIWTKDEPTGSNTSIEYLIYQVKTHRNNACHEIGDISEKELLNKLTEMRIIYTKLVKRVLTDETHNPKKFIEEKLNEINENLMSNPIFESLENFASHNDEIKRAMTELDETTKNSCRLILKRSYEGIDESNLIEWLTLPKMKIEDIFTEVSVVKEKEDHRPEENYGYNEIFSIKSQTQKKDPRIYTVVGNGGNGKTTYTRVIVCKWGTNQTCILHLDEFDLLFYIELRDENDKRFDDLIRYRLGDVMTDVGLSFQMLKQIIMRLNVLFILDGQDEAKQNDLLIDLLGVCKTQSNMKLMITSRPTASKDLQTIINKCGGGLPKVDLMLNGISLKNQLIFITRIVKVMETDAVKQNDILKSVEEDLPKLNEAMGDIMLSPLILTLLSVLWVTGEMSNSMTTTDIFKNINEQLKEKLYSRLMMKIGVDDNLKANIEALERYLEKVGFLTLMNKELTLSDLTISEIKKKLKQYNLSGVTTEIFEHYMAAKKSIKNYRQILHYSYKHLRLQEYAASKYVIQVLTSGNEEAKLGIMQQIKEEDSTNIRAHTIALMAENHTELLAEYGKAIIDCERLILSNTEGDNGKIADGYLQLVFESKSNQEVVNMISVNMEQMNEWHVKSSSSMAALTEILEVTIPEKLVINFRFESQLVPTLLSNFRKIAGYDLELQLTLPPIPDDSNAATHSEWIMAATSNDSHIKLTKFTGYLGKESLHQLPSSLQYLSVGISIEDMKTLFGQVNQLTKLYFLAIYMKCSNIESVMHLPKLPITAPSSMVSLYGAEDKDGPHIATLMQRCDSGKQLTLNLWEANLTGDGAVQLLKQLSGHQVRCNKIDITSNSELSKEQEQEIQIEAITCVKKKLIWNDNTIYSDEDASKTICNILATGDEEAKQRIMKHLEEGSSNIRAQTIGRITESQPKLLGEYVKAIIDCERLMLSKKEEDDGKVVDGYLQAVLESKSNQDVVNMISNNMAQMKEWRVESSSNIAVVTDILDITLPEILVLYFCDQSQLASTLPTHVQKITSYGLALGLVLPTTPDDSNAATHNEVLRAASSHDSHAKLIEFNGPITKEAFQQLPSTLEYLGARITVEDLPDLFGQVNQLTKLETLDIYMKCSQMDSVVHLPKLSIAYLFTAVHLENAEDNDCPHIVKLLQSCDGGTELDLDLREASITEKGALLLLRSLSENQVMCDLVDIHSSYLIKEDQEQEIRDEASRCVKGKLHWNGNEIYSAVNVPNDDDGDDDNTVDTADDDSNAVASCY